MLTTGIDTVPGTAGNDTIVGDNTTLGASDTIDGGAGVDTLNYTDSSLTGIAPQGLVKNVEIINVRNVNGTAGTAATKETATIVFGAVAATDTVIIGGQTFTGAVGGSTAADAAAYFSTNLPAGYTLTSTNGTTLTFTSTATGNDPANLANTGTSASTAITVVDGANAVPSAGIPLTVNASNFAGATDFNSNLSTQVVNFTNLTAGQKVGLIGNGAAVLGNVSAEYGAGVTATVVNVSGGVGPAGTTAPTVTLSGPTVANTATINSTGSAANTLGGVVLGGQATALTVNADARLSTGAISGFTGATAAITVKGAAAGTAAAAAVNLGTIDAAVNKIDASGLTVGGVAAVLNNNQTITFTGGQGQDIVTTGAILTTGLVDAGAGTTDRLIVSTTNDINATTGKLYKNFEQVQVNDGQTVNLSLLASTNTIDTIRINDGGGVGATGVTNLTAAQAANVTILAANATGAITIGVKDAEVAGQIDTVKATLVNTNAAGTAGVAVDLTGLILTGVEKLELTGTGATAATSGAVTLTTTAALALDSIKLTTAGIATVTVDASHAGTNLTIDGSASTGALTLNAVAYAAGSTGSSLIGGSGADTLLGATARADKLVGGAGNDVIVGSALTGGTLTAGTATAIGTYTGGTVAGSTASDILTGGAGKDAFVLGINSAATTISSITDLDLGGATLALGQDQITLDMANTAAATIYTLSAGQQTAITAAVDLATALDLVAAATNAATNNGTAQFTYGTDTYLFVNSSSTTATYVAGTDAVIKITGVVGTLDASDIVFI